MSHALPTPFSITSQSWHSLKTDDVSSSNYRLPFAPVPCKFRSGIASSQTWKNMVRHAQFWSNNHEIHAQQILHHNLNPRWLTLRLSRYRCTGTALHYLGSHHQHGKESQPMQQRLAQMKCNTHSTCKCMLLRDCTHCSQWIYHTCSCGMSHEGHISHKNWSHHNWQSPQYFNCIHTIACRTYSLLLHVLCKYKTQMPELCTIWQCITWHSYLICIHT